MPDFVRYISPDEDSGRWDGFAFRPGDIVISTRSKSGTTWMQMICALLVFGSADLDAPVSVLSPWLDWLVKPRDEVFALLAAQRHRRFIKTHTPLDGIPLDPAATYIVVGRHPLDMAVSLYHQGSNLNRERMRELTGRPAPAEPAKPRPPLHEWLLGWIGSDDDPAEQLDSLPGVMWHMSDAWRRGRVLARADGQARAPNVVLVHYDDLIADLEGQMRGLARVLGIKIAQATWPSLVRAATFDSMKAAAANRAPDAAGVLKDPVAFFRRGSSGAGREVLTEAEYAGYLARAAELAPADLLTWLHHEAT
jgi:aryl sulfotransferase